MEIKLLNKEYIKSEEFYKCFLENKLLNNDKFISNDVVYIEDAPSFPIYINSSDNNKREILYLEAFDVIARSYINTNREIHFNEVFWHSLFCIYKREYLLEEYPEIQDSISKFRNIILKKFNWENYIYKCIMAVQYVVDNVIEEEREKYFKCIINNLDIYNYILKSRIFRNDKFLINILDIIIEYDLSRILKTKVNGRNDLGKDERIGRRIIFEFDKSYPIILAPMLSKEELKYLFFKYLNYYADEQQYNTLLTRESYNKIKGYIK